MTFSSFTFMVFFITVYLVILIFNSNRICERLNTKTRLNIKHSILLTASYIFYGWWDYRFCFLMFGLTFVAWICAKMIVADKHRKMFTFIGIVTPLAVLGFFKYFNFFISSFTDAFGMENPGTLSIILPVGISFYTFQSMSYTIDVLRKKAPVNSFLKVALYVSFFPQLVAGPIVKASEFMPQLESDHKLKLSDLSAGVQIFVFGLFKKLVLADNISVFVDNVFEKPLAYSSFSVILAVIAYSIQIYCDFSGYSDMAIGAARCLGYSFKPNFNMPYISRNVTEFWKRWHISLSTWLQEYLYIPLGGNRKGKTRKYINLMLTMVLGGLWHGANYTFILWGFMHGAALCIHKVYMTARKGKKPHLTGSLISIIFTYTFICLCWVPFRAPDIQTAIDIFTRIFIPHDGITQVFSWAIFGVAVIIIANLTALIKSIKQKSPQINGFYPILNLNKILPLILFFTFVLLTLCLAYTNSNPFIYFQF